jgi:hypothetical protein
VLSAAKHVAPACVRPRRSEGRDAAPTAPWVGGAPVLPRAQVTAGVRPLSGESPTNSPLKPEEGCQLSQLAQAALQQIFFMYDTDLNGHLQMNDLTAQHAAPFVRGTGIDLTAKSGEPLPQGKYICLADHHPAGLTCTCPSALHTTARPPELAISACQPTVPMRRAWCEVVR